MVPLVLSAGCVVARNGFRHQDREVAEVARPVASVDLEVSAGEVAVGVDPSAQSTAIARTTRWNGGPQPCTTSSYADGAVALGDSCNGGNCAVDYDIALSAPASVTVIGGSGDVTLAGVGEAIVDLGSGDIVLTDVAGDATVSTGSGDMDLTRIGGNLELSTGSGDIVSTALTAPITSATTGSGDVALVYVATPERVEVVTGSGDASLVVPFGTYHIVTHSSSGDVTINDLVDGDGPLLSVDVESGDISISGE
jgi:hypothetical protein